MANDLKFSVTFDAVTAQFNGAIAQASTAFNATAAKIQSSSSAIGASTVSAGQQAAQGGAAISGSMGTAAAATTQAAAAGNKLGNDFKQTNAELARATQVAGGMGGAFDKLSGALASLGLGLSTKEIVGLADAFKDLQSQIRLVTGSGDALTTAYAGILEISNATFSTLTSTAGLFRKVSDATVEMGKSQSEVLAITKTVNQAVLLSGASSEAATAAIIQFNQALASGRLGGEEFNSVSEQAPRLLKVFKDELGLTTGELRALAREQKLTSDLLIKALEGQAGKVNAEFATLTNTVGNAMSVLKNNLLDYIGKVDAAGGYTTGLYTIIVKLASNLDALGAALSFVAKAALAYKLVDLATFMFAKATAATAAAAALRTQAASTTQVTTVTAANTTATAANTGVVVSGGAAARGAAAGRTALVTATIADTSAKTANTAATNANAASAATLSRNIGGTTPNLNAAGAAAVSMGAKFIGAFSWIAIAYLAISVLKDLGKWMGEAAAKAVLWATGESDAEKKAQAAWDESERAIARLNEAKKQAAIANAIVKESQVGLSESSSKVVAEFDKMRESGKGVAESLKGITKGMDFSNLDGINNAVTALNALARQGKATGEQVRQALQDELADVDLTAFQANSAKAFADLVPKINAEIDKLGDELLKKQAELREKLAKYNSAEWTKDSAAQVAAVEGQIAETRAKILRLQGEVAEGAAKMAIVHDAVLNEALRRTGVEVGLLGGRFNSTSNSAVGDVAIIVKSLDELKDQGVNTGLALSAGLSRAIEESNTQEEIARIARQVEGLRGELGNKVADGLLNEAAVQAIKLKDSLDDATAGVNSVREAFREFGLKTRDEYQAIADRQKSAFDEMRNSGQATTEQLKDAFGKYAESAIAANGGVADGFVTAQAAALGMEVTTDKTGKTVVKAMDDAKDSTDKVTRSVGGAGKAYKALGDAAEDAGSRAVQSIEEQVAATRKLALEQAKARDEQLSKERGATVNSVDNLAGVGLKAYSVENIAQALESLGYKKGRAASEGRRIMDEYVSTENRKGILSRSLSNASFVDAALQKIRAEMSQERTGLGGALPDFVKPKTTNVNITAGGKSVSANVPSDQESDFLSILEQSQRLT